MQVSIVRLAMVIAAVTLLTCPLWAAPKSKPTGTEVTRPELLLEGGRRLSWERSFDSELAVKPARGFFTKVFDAIAGAPETHSLVKPYSVVTDSKGRIIVTDPGISGVHIFDFAQHKYKFLQRTDKEKDRMLTPQCVAVDADDNIYVTDSDAGVIFVFDSSGKYRHALGSLKGGEGYFKRPTGIAVDSVAQRIYVTDTLRDQVFVLDMQGTVLQTIGKPGEADGEFNLPTELRLQGPNLIVVDAMNFRVQVFDRSGKFQYSVGKIGDSVGAMFRPKAVSVDSEGDLYIVDAWWNAVQIFNPQGELLYHFGSSGTHAGEFQLPAGLFIDHDDRIYVVDSFNRRIQVFRYFGLKPAASGGAR
jgi:DNA-binding beta-propeller fold protein YncE